MSDIRQCVNRVLVAGEDDYVYLAEITVCVYQAGIVKDIDLERVSVDLLQSTIDVVRLVLQQELMEVGDLKRDGFYAWNVSIADAVKRIEREWRLLNRNPSLGEICWFRNTAKGNAIAEALLNSGWQ